MPIILRHLPPVRYHAEYNPSYHHNEQTQSHIHKPVQTLPSVNSMLLSITMCTRNNVFRIHRAPLPSLGGCSSGRNSSPRWIKRRTVVILCKGLHISMCVHCSYTHIATITAHAAWQARRHLIIVLFVEAIAPHPPCCSCSRISTGSRRRGTVVPGRTPIHVRIDSTPEQAPCQQYLERICYTW